MRKAAVYGALACVGLCGFTQAQARSKTRGRAITAQGKAWVDASIHFVARLGDRPNGEPWIDHVVVRSDDRGKFDAELIKGFAYCAWAASRTSPRYESSNLHTGVFAGRPIRLVADGHVRERWSYRLSKAAKAHGHLSYFASPGHGIRMPAELLGDRVLPPRFPENEGLLFAIDRRGVRVASHSPRPLYSAPKDLEFTLMPTAEIEFDIADPDRKVLAGTRVLQPDTAKFGIPRATLEELPNGKGKVSCPLPRRLPELIGAQLELAADACCSERGTFHFRGLTPEFATPVFRVLRPALTVRGRVIYNGRAVPKLRVRAYRAFRPGKPHSVHSDVWTDAEGRFELPVGQRRARYTLTAILDPKSQRLFSESRRYVVPEIVLIASSAIQGDGARLGDIDLAKLPSRDIQLLTAERAPLTTGMALLRLPREKFHAKGYRWWVPFGGRVRVLGNGLEDCHVLVRAGAARGFGKLSKSQKSIVLVKTVRVRGVLHGLGGPAAGAFVSINEFDDFYQPVRTTVATDGSFELQIQQRPGSVSIMAGVDLLDGSTLATSVGRVPGARDSEGHVFRLAQRVPRRAGRLSSKTKPDAARTRGKQSVAPGQRKD